MRHPQAKVHRMFELVEPVATVTFCEMVDEAFLALGMRNYWDGYFAGRAAPLGPAPAEVVHAVFYNFADGEVARHIPWVWGKTTPQEAIAVRERGSAAALRQLIGELADSPALVRVTDLATRAAVSAPTEGRALYAGLRALDVPAEPVARLWHAATLLREHRGDGHNAALLAHGVGGTEAHVLLAASLDAQRPRCPAPSTRQMRMGLAASDGMIVDVDTRLLTERERAVLGALLAADLPKAEHLQRQAANVVVVGMCGCGCPSIDFRHGRGLGMSIRVNAGVRGSHDGLFLHTVEDPEGGEVPGGIEWVGVNETDPDEFPSPDLLDIRPV